MSSKGLRAGVWLWITAVLGACDPGYEPGEAWDGPDHGVAAPAMGPDDAAADDGDAPVRDPAPAFEPLEDEDEDENEDEDEPAPEDAGDPECEGTGFLAEAYTDCDPGEVFADGCCWSSFTAACDGLACATECLGITTVPMSAACVPE